MKKLILNLGGGIGNRLLGLFKGIYIFENYFKNKNYKLIINHIYSSKDLTKLLKNFNNDANKKFNSIFSVDVSKKQWEIIAVLSAHCPIKKLFSLDYQIVSSYEQTNLLKNLNIKNFDIDYEIIGDKIKTDNYLIPESFKINPEILEKVNYFCNRNNINENTIGFHVRLTDRRNDKYKDLLLKINVLLKEDKKIFLCTDEEEFKKLVPKEVIIYEIKHFPQKIESENELLSKCLYRSDECIIEAFIELLILSRTKIITNCKKSTYYQVAKMLKNYH